VKIKELSERLDVSENSIKSWFNQYEQQGFEGLLDANMAHNQSGLSKESPEAIIAALHEAPQNLTQVVAILEDKYQIKTNKSKLRNYLKKKV
jgi:transposase